MLASPRLRRMMRSLLAVASVGILLGGQRAFAIDERKIGDDYAKQLAKQYKVYEDPRVTEIGNKISEVAGITGMHFYAIDEGKQDQPNAFQIPYHIYATKSLLKLMDNTSLSFILGHEMGHQMYHHLAKQMQHDQNTSIFAAILGAVVGIRPNTAGDFALQIAGGALINKYSRKQEGQADVFGLEVIHDLGIPFTTAAASFKKLGADHQSRFMNSLFGNHPMMKDRISKADTANKWLFMRPTDVFKSPNGNVAVVWPFVGEGTPTEQVRSLRAGLRDAMELRGYTLSEPSQYLRIWAKLHMIYELPPDVVSNVAHDLGAQWLVDAEDVSSGNDVHGYVFDIRNGTRVEAKWTPRDGAQLGSLIQQATQAPASAFKPY